MTDKFKRTWRKKARHIPFPPRLILIYSFWARRQWLRCGTTRQGCDGRAGELRMRYQLPTRCGVPRMRHRADEPHDKCSNKQARGGALCDGVVPASCSRPYHTGELHALVSSSTMRSIHPPKHQGDIALQPHGPSVCSGVSTVFGWMFQVVYLDVAQIHLDVAYVVIRI
jgi:hypothetical protein